jgi:hypothetical protein
MFGLTMNFSYPKTNYHFIGFITELMVMFDRNLTIFKLSLL